MGKNRLPTNSHGENRTAVSGFSFPVQWRSRVSSNHVTSNTFARASCFFWLVRWSLGAIQTMLQGLGTLFRCQGFFEHVDSNVITHPFLLTAVDASPCFTMTRVELDLHVKTIVLLTSREPRDGMYPSRWGELIIIFDCTLSSSGRFHVCEAHPHVFGFEVQDQHGGVSR